MAHHHDQHHRQGHDPHTAPGGRDWAELGELLELEAELSGCLDEAVSTVTRVSTRTIRRIADVGCGPGVATTALLEAFPEARAIALDRSPELLRMVRDRAQRAGVADRVTTETRDLEALNGALREMDLVWAGMVLHHVATLPEVLRQLHDSLALGGLLAIAELGPPTRTLPDDLGFGAPRLGERLLHATAAAREAHLPPGAMTIDWPAMLRAAGFELVESRTLRIRHPAPLNQRARQFVLEGLLRAAQVLDPTITSDDRATIAVLTDPNDPRSVMKRDDVMLEAGRELFVARKT